MVSYRIWFREELMWLPIQRVCVKSHCMYPYSQRVLWCEILLSKKQAQTNWLGISEGPTPFVCALNDGLWNDRWLSKVCRLLMLNTLTGCMFFVWFDVILVYIDSKISRWHKWRTHISLGVCPRNLDSIATKQDRGNHPDVCRRK